MNTKGLTTTQKRQVVYLDACVLSFRFSNKNLQGPSVKWNVRCRTCDKEITTPAPNEARRFVSNHPGHDTWVTQEGVKK